MYHCQYYRSDNSSVKVTFYCVFANVSSGLDSMFQICYTFLVGYICLCYSFGLGELYTWGRDEGHGRLGLNAS